jgi:hypothetical protein
MTKEDRAVIMAIFTPVLGEELAADIIAHRNGKKCPLTPRGARSLLREYEATGNAVAAAEEHLNRGWQGFKADWIKKPGAFTDTNNPSAKTETREDYIRRAIEQNKREWEGPTDPAIAAKARMLVRGALQ